MDPVGLSLGAVSLVFQLFAGCMKAYNLLSEAQGMEKTYRFYLVRFKTEQYRLLDWAIVAQLPQTELEETTVINKTNRAIVAGILDELHRLLMRFGRLDERLRPLASPFIVEDMAQRTQDQQQTKPSDMDKRFPRVNDLLTKAISFVDATRKYPARLRWASCDKASIEEVLSRVVELNNSLRDLLSAEQMLMLQRNEVTTQYQIVQLNNKIDQLLEIVQAGLVVGRAGAQLDDLVQVAKFKALLSATNTKILSDSLRSQLALGYPTIPQSLDLPSSGLLSEDKIVLEDAVSSIQQVQGQANRRANGWYRLSDSRQPRLRIWIEWTGVEPRRYSDPNSGPDHKTMQRFEALVTLLRESQQTIQFRALPCLGYFLQTKGLPYSRFASLQLRYGLVFCLPPNVDPNSRAISLRQLMTSKAGESCNMVPCLSKRLALMRTLAQSVERLHAVGWLHKGLCSDNVLFFCSDGTEADLDLTQFYLSGFDYSRPADTASMSDSPATPTLLEDIYRHPDIQGQSPADKSNVHVGFSRHHDIYSLGIVLWEIAEWRPIEEIVEVHSGNGRGGLMGRYDNNETNSRLSAAVVLKTRMLLLRLLGSPEHSRLAALVGSAIARGIWSCIEGGLFFKTGGVKQDEGPMEEAAMQGRFYDAVIKPLFTVHVF